jgi:hypothetical protein
MMYKKVGRPANNGGLTEIGDIINNSRDRRPAIRLGGMFRNVLPSVWLGQCRRDQRCDSGKKRDDPTGYHGHAVSFQNLEATSFWTLFN